MQKNILKRILPTFQMNFPSRSKESTASQNSQLSLVRSSQNLSQLPSVNTTPQQSQLPTVLPSVQWPQQSQLSVVQFSALQQRAARKICPTLKPAAHTFCTAKPAHSISSVKPAPHSVYSTLKATASIPYTNKPAHSISPKPAFCSVYSTS